MTFGQAVKTVLTTRYADFSGRSTRSEYWWYQLFVSICMAALFIPMVAGIATTAPDGTLGGTSLVLVVVGGIALAVFFLATLVPGIALTVRRLHDVGMSGWFYLIAFVPYAGSLALLVIACLDSKPANQWGPNPKHTDLSAWSYGQAVPGLAGQGVWPQHPISPPAGWYPDPSGTARLRYWDGASWTEHVSS